MRPLRRKRFPVGLASPALMLGAMTTIAVAWCFALYATQPSSGETDSGASLDDQGRWVRWDSTSSCGITKVACEIAYDPIRIGHELQLVLSGCSGARTVTVPVGIPPCSLPLQMPTTQGANSRDYTVFGWPYPCLWAARDEGIYLPSFSDFGPVGVIELGPGECTWQYQSRTRLLPARPIWPEFAKNTVLYAAAWTPLLFAPSGIKRALRRKAGHCPSCNYNLQGLSPLSPCPECGRA